MADQRSKPRGGTAAGDHDGPRTSYQVVARRFRPKAFDELVGQEAIQATLRAELGGGRVPHAFVFAGVRGVGKTTTARILARCLNCEQGPTPEPCGSCALCRSVLDGTNPDVLEINAASNRGIDDVRPLIERVATASMVSRYRVYILDEAHMLTTPAFNALLKTLEEPPPRVVFVLATTELHRLPDTIRSRCQVLQFRRIGDADIGARLRRIVDSEGIAIGDDVLHEIAVSSSGSMRDAETALERAMQVARDHQGEFDLAAYRELTQHLGIDRAVEVVRALQRGDAAAGLRFCRDLQDAGGDERQALGDLVDVLRAVLVLQVDGPDSGLVSHVGAVREQLAALAAAAQRHQVEAMIQAAVLGRDRLRRLEDRAAILELTLVRMAEAGSLPSLGELVAAARDGALGATAAAAPAAAMGAGASGASDAAGGDLRVRVLAAAREEPLKHATLELCSFSGPDAQGRVVLRMDSDRKMHRDRLQSPQLQQQVTNWVKAAAGRPVTVEFQFGAAQASQTPAAGSAAASPPGADTQRVLSRFGGRVVAVNPEERRPVAPEGPSDVPPAPVDEPD